MTRKSLIRYLFDPDPAATPFYAALSCESHSVRFFPLLTHLGLTHLGFSRARQLAAMTLLREHFPNIRAYRTSAEGSLCETMLREVISGHIPPPDFMENPFLRAATPFQKKIWQTMADIGSGETWTYGELAARAGSPGAARAVGRACNRNPLPLVIPCHRVVGSRSLGGFAAELSIKARLLELEQQWFR